MKQKEKTQLSGSTLEELVKAVHELEKTLEGQLIKQYNNQPKNVRDLKNMRRKISVYKTIIRQKELSV